MLNSKRKEKRKQGLNEHLQEKQTTPSDHTCPASSSFRTESKCPGNPAAFTQIQTRLPLTPRKALNSLNMCIVLINCKNEKRQTRY